jgi:hypothetical protein
MTMIDPACSARTSAAAPPGMRQTGSAFRVAESAGSGGSEAAGPVGDTAQVSLGVMLAAEALDREAAGDQAARRQGQVVLGGLTALQRALLEGGDQQACLERLGALVAEMPPAVDPRLAALLGTIVLRARIELARLGQPEPPSLK